MLNKSQNKHDAKMEKAIGNAMRIGVGIAAILMIFGFVLLLITFKDNFEGIKDVSFQTIALGLTQLNPYSYMLLGIFVLILTPVVRVVSTIILFAKSKDKLYTFITIFVLIVLLTSFCVGLISF